ncbi:putative ribonuclease H-like domain-containing protein [Tanacetum coccineum]
MTGRDHDGRVIILPLTTVDEHIVVQRESKARTTLLQSIPDDYVADFHYIDDARDIWNAVKARFGGNAESKKIRKSMLKQEFSEFRISEAEGLHKGYDRMQKILSQLNQLKAKPEDEDSILSTLEVDNRHPGYSIFLQAQSAGPSHSAFVSTTNASKKMSYADSPSYTSSTYTVPSNSKTGSHRSGNVIEDLLQSFVADTKPEQQLAYEDFDQIEKLYLKEMDLKWQMDMLSVRVHKFEQKAGRKIDFDKKESASSTKRRSDVTSTEHDGQSDGVITPKEFGMIAGCDTEDTIKEGAAKIYNLITELYKEGQYAVMWRNLSLMVSLLGWDDSAFSVFTTNSKEMEGRPLSVVTSLQSVSTSESEAEIESNVGTPIQEPIIVQDFLFIKDCNYYETQYPNDFDGVGYPQREPIWDNATRVTQSNQFVPQAVLLRSGKVSIPAARPNQVPAGRPKPVSTGRPKPVSTGRPKPVSTGAPVSTGKQNRPPLVHAGRRNSSSVTSGWWQSTARPMTHLPSPTSSYFQTYTPYVPQMYYNHMQYGGVRWATAVKPSAGCSWKKHRKGLYWENSYTDAEDEGIFDSSCSRSGEVDYGKGTIRTPHWILKMSNYVKELATFNCSSILEFVTENRVLFTDNDCLYDIKGNFACLVAKASVDESVQWHRRMGHVNYKNMNRLADEGYIVGYSASNKAYRVYNVPTKRVEETMNLRYLEEKPNVQGLGHEWYFDLDYLTDSLGYKRDKANQSAGTHEASTNPAGTQDADSDSECDEQVIIIPSYPSHSIQEAEPKDISGDEVDDSPLDSAEEIFQKELARLKGQEQRATSDAKDTEELQERAIEPRSVAQALEDPSWVDAMQEEMQQFKFQNVWVLVDLPEDKYAIGTKWILKNKRDARGIVVRNKARLVAQGHRQEEGIDYDEVFAPVARIEAIRLFLAFASYLGFMVYQMDIKSALLYGRIDEEVYVTQPKGFRNTQDPNKVYKHKRDIIPVQVYVDDIIFGIYKKAGAEEFDLEYVRTATTPYEAPKPKSKNEPDSPVNVHLYRSMIVKKIFKYLKGQPRLGLWYPRELPFVLEAYSDSDYDGSNKDRKSTSGGCQFLGRRLISWQCKKQTIVATSSTEAEYVAAANCCGQVVFIFPTGRPLPIVSTHNCDQHPAQNLNLISTASMAALRYRDEHNKVGYLQKPKGSDDYHQILNFLGASHIRSPKLGPPAILATINATPYTITKDSVRGQLQLADDGGIDDLPVADIYSRMDNLGYVTEGKLTFYKNKFSPQWRFLVHTILHCLSTKSGSWDQFGSQISVALICLSDRRKFNWSSYIFKGMVSNIGNAKMFLMYPRFLQTILAIETSNTTQYKVFKLSSKLFANMKLNFEGQPMPLLAAMLSQVGEGVGVVVPTVPQITPEPIPEPMPETDQPKHGQSSDPDIASFSQVQETNDAPFTSTNVDDEPLRGSFHAFPPRSTQASLAGHTSRGTEDPITLTALSSVVSTLVQKVNSLEMSKDKKLSYGCGGKVVQTSQSNGVETQDKERKVVVSDFEQDRWRKIKMWIGCSNAWLMRLISPPVNLRLEFRVASLPHSDVTEMSGVRMLYWSFNLRLVIQTATLHHCQGSKDARKGKGVAVEEPTPTQDKTFKQLEEERPSRFGKAKSLIL